MAQIGTIADVALIEADDITNISATSLSLYGARNVCVTIEATASANCDLTVNFACGGTQQIFSKSGGVIIPNETLSFTGITAGEFVVVKKMDVSGYSEVLPLDCTVTAGAVTGVKMYIESSF